jgi:hypothetical protein
VRAAAIGTERGPRHAQRPERKPRSAGANVERDDRPHEIEDVVGAVAAIAEDAAREGGAFAEIDRDLETCGVAEQRLAFAKRVRELGIVAVEQHFGSERDRSLDFARDRVGRLRLHHLRQ